MPAKMGVFMKWKSRLEMALGSRIEVWNRCVQSNTPPKEFSCFWGLHAKVKKQGYVPPFEGVRLVKSALGIGTEPGSHSGKTFVWAKGLNLEVSLP